jgi:hypothetical protein
LLEHGPASSSPQPPRISKNFTCLSGSKYSEYSEYPKRSDSSDSSDNSSEYTEYSESSDGDEVSEKKSEKSEISESSLSSGRSENPENPGSSDGSDGSDDSDGSDGNFGEEDGAKVADAAWRLGWRLGWSQSFELDWRQVNAKISIELVSKSARTRDKTSQGRSRSVKPGIRDCWGWYVMIVDPRE